MKIISKGGVWKNTEDEILKSAVMKYGKNQWARISSLIVRKSAKQCKARWYQWLDPSIKKTEWSREEEEKLLHLAKILPNQWKTIAPIVGRTASQCLEHYEKLLDAAQNRGEEDDADDPRRLRPGEIDPNPESKPARPDPIDMDEDEKEMLSEARARLANTQGKKAKRKAREKQLEEARRLASLQKRRELKAAGIELPKVKQVLKGMDYNKEIPFYKKPAPGFYEVDWDAETPKVAQQRPLLDSLEGKRRREEEAEKKEDIKKRKVKEKKDLPAAIMQVNKLNDPAPVAQRTPLFLPAPQVSDADWESLGKEQEPLPQGATAALLPTFATPAPRTPVPRTPVARTPAGGGRDRVREEAAALAALREAGTPLHGGTAVPLPRDFGGMTPARPPPTPPPATPSHVTVREEGLRWTPQPQGNLSLQDQLRSLPQPQNEYLLTLPELPQEMEEEEERAQEPDASDVLAAQRHKEASLAAHKERIRSQPLQRNLPRPFAIPPSYSQFRSQEDPSLQAAEALLQAEVVRLLRYEAREYPYPRSLIDGLHEYEDFEEPLLQAAHDLIAEESAKVKAELYAGGFSPEEFARVWQKQYHETIYSPSEKTFQVASQLSKKDRIAALTHRFEAAKALMGKEAGRAKRLAHKVGVYTGGYQTRATSLITDIQTLSEELDQRSTELECFTILQTLERTAAPARIEELALMVQRQEEREADLQKKYAELRHLVV